jgi:hypothetical protein
MGVKIQVSDSLADDLMDGGHGIPVDGEAADGNVAAVLDIFLDGIAQGHDFVITCIHAPYDLLHGSFLINGSET